MSETYPTRETMKRFSQDIYPSSVGIDDKGSEKFADEQEKCTFRCICLFRGGTRARVKCKI